MMREIWNLFFPLLDLHLGGNGVGRFHFFKMPIMPHDSFPQMHNVATEKGAFLKAAAFSSANFGVAPKRGEVERGKTSSACIQNAFWINADL